MLDRLDVEHPAFHFLAHHADLLSPDFWNHTKTRIEQGFIEDVFPYAPSARFSVRYRTNGAGEAVDVAAEAPLVL
jgi:isocitrate dehydrogenase kinase/phosphatase